MARRVRCPACGHEFHVDTTAQLAACHECDRLFNPRKQSDIPTGEP